MVPVGAEAPDFTLTATDGSAVQLSDLRGKLVVLVFLRGFQ
jgi:peroxiredoxin